MKKRLLIPAILPLFLSCFSFEASSQESEKEVKKPEANFQDNEKNVKKSEEAPEFSFSGSATVSMNYANPELTYYDGKNQPEQIKNPELNKSDGIKSKDTSLARCVGEAELKFGVKGKLHSGWIYGAELSLDAAKKDTGINNMYVFFERDNFGTIHAGNVKGPDGKLLCGGQELIGGAGGVDGFLPDDIDYATGVISPLNVIGHSKKATKVAYYTPKMYGFQLAVGITPDTKHSGHEKKDRHSGKKSSSGNDEGIFNIGGDVFFAQDTPPNKDKYPSGRNNIAFGLTHGHDFNNGWGTQVAAIYVMENTRSVNLDASVKGDVYLRKDKKVSNGKEYVFPFESMDEKAEKKYVQLRKVKLRNTRAWQLTGTVSYKDFSVGAGYLNNGRSRLPAVSEYVEASTKKMVLPGGFMSAKDGNSGQAWNIGMRYKYKEWTFSGVYHNTSRKITAGQKAKGNMYTLATDYLVCSGLKIFAEIDYVISRSGDYACATYNLARTGKNAVKKQKTGLFVVGAKVCF